MIIQNRQGVTADTVAQEKIALEICLPHFVAVMLLEPLESPVFHGFRRFNQPVALENVAAGLVTGQPLYTGSL